MRRSMRYRALVVTSALLTWSRGASAQADSLNHWRFSLTPYLWLTGLSGKVGVGPVDAKVDLGVGDVLDKLKFGIMGYGEARKGPWVIGLDGIYASFGEEHVFAIRGDTGQLNLTQSETIINPTGGYTIGDNTWAVDFLGGLRYWHLGSSIDVDPATRRPSNKRSGSRSWVDATAGARFRWVPLPKTRVILYADGGGGGAHSDFQAYGSAGYDAWTRWTFSLTYRWIGVDYDSNNFLFDTDTKGFLIGVTYRFY